MLAYAELSRFDVMKNNILDLNNHLFAQLEALNDCDVKGAELAEEIARAKAISGLSTCIINNAKLAFDVAKFKYEENTASLPEQLECKNIPPK